MAKFQWEATTRSGETKRGAMEAESADIVENRLRSDGLTVSRVRREAPLGCALGDQPQKGLEHGCPCFCNPWSDCHGCRLDLDHL